MINIHTDSQQGPTTTRYARCLNCLAQTESRGRGLILGADCDCGGSVETWYGWLTSDDIARWGDRTNGQTFN